jgi:hypothetical protein
MAHFSQKNRFEKNLLKGLFGYGALFGLFVSVLAALVLNFIPNSATALNDSILTEKELKRVEKNLSDASRSLEDLSGEYHATVNQIMNGYMKIFTHGEAIIAPPKNPGECKAIGATMNVSTYCLFLRIDPIYQRYAATLSLLENTALERLQNILDDRQDVSANYYAARSEWVKREFSSTQKALDAGLQAYSELLLQYPMHQEYQKTIALLVKYYDRLVDLRKNIDTFPARFHNVTTAQCE